MTHPWYVYLLRPFTFSLPWSCSGALSATLLPSSGSSSGWSATPAWASSISLLSSVLATPPPRIFYSSTGPCRCSLCSLPTSSTCTLPSQHISCTVTIALSGATFAAGAKVLLPLASWPRKKKRNLRRRRGKPVASSTDLPVARQQGKGQEETNGDRREEERWKKYQIWLYYQTPAHAHSWNWVYLFTARVRVHVSI